MKNKLKTLFKFFNMLSIVSNHLHFFLSKINIKKKTVQVLVYNKDFLQELAQYYNCNFLLFLILQNPALFLQNTVKLNFFVKIKIYIFTKFFKIKYWFLKKIYFLFFWYILIRRSLLNKVVFFISFGSIIIWYIVPNIFLFLFGPLFGICALFLYKNSTSSMKIKNIILFLSFNFLVQSMLSRIFLPDYQFTFFQSLLTKYSINIFPILKITQHLNNFTSFQIKNWQISFLSFKYNMPFIVDNISIFFIELTSLIFFLVFCYECFGSFKFNKNHIDFLQNKNLLNEHLLLLINNVSKASGIQIKNCIFNKTYILTQLQTDYNFLQNGIKYYFWISQFKDHFLNTHMHDKKLIENLMKYLILQWFIFIAFLTQDLLIFYIAFECALIPMILMIGLKGSRIRKIRADYLFFLYTFMGSLFMLSALYLIFKYTHTFNINALLNIEKNTMISKSELRYIWFALFITFALKIPLVPFHSWLPEAHVEAATSSSVILAAILLKLGSYGMLRFLVFCFPETTLFFNPLTFALILISIFVSSIIALRQLDCKRIIAYSSINHMAICLLGLFSTNSIGIQGSIFLMISHGYVSAGLFFCIGMLYQRTHTRLIQAFSGIAQRMPLFSVFFIFFIFANIGLPCTFAFIAEYTIFQGIFASNLILGILALSSLLFVTIFSFKLYNQIIFNTIKEHQNHVDQNTNLYDLTLGEFFILTVLLIFILYFGINPSNFFILIPR